MKLYFNYLRKTALAFLVAMGCVLAFGASMALTTAPFWGIHHLGTANAKWVTPNKIVLLGGGGMPSESNLMRLWYTIEVFNRFHDAELIIAIPGDTTDTQSAICKMAHYAESHGVPFHKIRFENFGANTRSQALNIFNNFYSPSDTILLVTSPEHLHRAILAFQKAGVEHLGGIPAFPVALEGKLLYTDKECHTKKVIPDVGENLQIRYQFWTHLGYEIVLLREYCALAYYWLNDWI